MIPALAHTPRDRALQAALVFTFVCHGAAMLGMLVFLLPMVPGGGGAGDDLARIGRIAAAPASYRLGWFGWQITAVSDVLFAIALFRTEWAKKVPATLQLLFVALAVIPDQYAQLMLVTHGVDLATECATRGDPAPFLAFEATMFPLTSAWAAILYTLGAIGWTLTFRSGGRWNKLLERFSPPLYVLYSLISIGPILPRAIRPSPELIGAGNAVAFTLLELWFVALFFAVRKRSGEA